VLSQIKVCQSWNKYMKIAVLNKSRGKSFKVTKRLLSQVVQPIDLRFYIDDIPERVIQQLITNLNSIANKNTSIKIFISDNSSGSGYRGFRVIEIGRKHPIYKKYK